MTTKRALRKLPRFIHIIHKSSDRSLLITFLRILTTNHNFLANLLSAIWNFLIESIQSEVEHEFVIESHVKGQCVCSFGFCQPISGFFPTHLHVFHFLPSSRGIIVDISLPLRDKWKYVISTPPIFEILKMCCKQLQTACLQRPKGSQKPAQKTFLIPDFLRKTRRIQLLLFTFLPFNHELHP
jgi:hypothetical protein